MDRINRIIIGSEKTNPSSVKACVAKLKKLCRENLNHPSEGAVLHAQYYLAELEKTEPLLNVYFEKGDEFLEKLRQQLVHHQVVQTFHKTYGRP